MPTGSPVAPQPDSRPSASTLSANRLRFAVAARWTLGILAIVVVPALLPHPALAAPIATATKINGVHDQLLWPILCGTVGLIVFLILRAVVLLARKAIVSNSNCKQDGDSPATSVEHFVEDARRLHIDPQIARASFRVLASLLPAGSTIGANDDLREALRLSDQQIDSLLSAVSELCDRSRLTAHTASILSVYDLLQYVQSSPKSTSGQFYLRTGSTVPAPAISPTSPLADLRDASPRDSRFRTRAHFSGIKRRASDYSGPYRRATDRHPDKNYTGPLRRASDRQDAGSAGTEPKTDQRIGDRRSPEHRAVGLQENSEPAKQHRAVSADTSLLNQCLNNRPNQGGTEPERDRISALITREEVLLPGAPLQVH